MEVFDHLAGGYVAETGLDNSTLLVPLDTEDADFVAINNARWDISRFRFLWRAPMNWPSIGDFLLAVGVGWFILVVWATFGAMLATLSRGTSLAIGLGLVHLLAVEGLIAFAAQSPELIATLWRVLPRANAGSIAAALVPSGISGPGVEAAVGPAQATLVVAVYLIGFVLVTGMVFLKRDVT